MPPRPAGRIRSPSRHARTVTGAPSWSADSTASPPSPRCASTSQSPNRTPPGIGSVTAPAAAASGPRAKRTWPYSTTARTPPRDVELVGALVGQPQDLASARGRHGRAGEPREHQPRERQRARRAGRRAPARGRAARARRRRPPRPAPARREGGARSRRCCARRPGSARADAASPPASHARARNRCRRSLGSSRHSSPRSRHQARVSSRVTSSSGRTSRPRRGSIPSSARRPGDVASR